jgi:pyruvate,orthophosphate dikinase
MTTDHEVRGSNPLGCARFCKRIIAVLDLEKCFFHFNHKKQCDIIDSAILGGKGAALVALTNLGIQTPAGFIISTKISQYNNTYNKLPDNFFEFVKKHLLELGNITNKRFGDIKNPSLLSVRSGAVISMPGMMDSLLNIGLNDQNILYFIEKYGYGFAFDIYSKLITSYAVIVHNVGRSNFDFVLNVMVSDSLTFHENIEKCKKIFDQYVKMPFPQDILEQLAGAINAVLRSYKSPRALAYRTMNDIRENLGTAVTIQEMVFGNIDDNSCTGVLFSRNPSSGNKVLFGEYIICAQGEDIVSGTKTPVELSSLKNIMPTIYDELCEIAQRLEFYYKDMQDIEFTISEGKLYILQTRSGKRSASAAIKIAVDMVHEGLITKNDAILRIDPESLSALFHSTIDESVVASYVAKGLPASPGAVSGVVVFSPEKVDEFTFYGNVILARNDTSPEDICGMKVAVGLLTARGGMTSHAAVVARGMGKPCVCGVKDLVINDGLMSLNGHFIKEGDVITIDGNSGTVYIGSIKLSIPNLIPEYYEFMEFVDEVRDAKVRVNAETIEDTILAIKFGCEGVGLCRTEHMFFSEEKIALLRQVILSPDHYHRNESLRILSKLHEEDFRNLFKIMKGLPLNIRLLDPPLHEFLPKTSESDVISLIANSLDVPESIILDRLDALKESNPMLGHRGCRLGITFPEIYQMQAEAIIRAALSVVLEGVNVVLEIMVPLISDVNEFIVVKKLIQETLLKNDINQQIKYSIGTMIELPRAALQAGAIAKEVDFFSFGTNDLTQTTFGISRDDIGSFMPHYLFDKIFASNPFVHLDVDGVGELMHIACERGLKSNKHLKFGVCGEHAGDPDSIKFFHKIGVEYVSCSPYRIPIAKIALAKIAIQK